MPGEWFQFAIELKDTGVLIGDCGLKVNKEEPRQAEFGITLSPPYQGVGVASEAVACMLDYAFKILGLHRVIAITDCLNKSSVVLMERLGMRREGHFIQNVWFKGAWGDEYLYAILQQEWLEKKNDPPQWTKGIIVHKRVNFGEVLVRSLEAYGVDTVFGIPGVHTLELLSRAFWTHFAPCNPAT